MTEVGSYDSAIFIFLRNLHTVSLVPVLNYSPTNSEQVSLSPHLCQHCYLFLVIVILTCVRWYLIMVLICILNMISDVYLSHTCVQNVCLLWKTLQMHCSLFFLTGFLLLSYMNSLYVLDTISL